MAYTAPRTWVAGETVTAAMLNTDVRDNLKAIGDPWGPYTPAWTASTTNPTLGGGTLTGNYLQVGKWVRFRIDLVIGSTTFTGTGIWSFSLPVQAIGAVGVRGPVGMAVCYNGTTSFPRLVYCVNSTAVGVADMVPNRISPTVPFTWTSAMELHINGEYEAL